MMFYKKLWLLFCFVSFGIAQDTTSSEITDIATEHSTAGFEAATTIPEMTESILTTSSEKLESATVSENLETATQSSDFEVGESTTESSVEPTTTSFGETSATDVDASSETASETQSGSIPEETVPVYDLSDFVEPAAQLTEEEAFCMLILTNLKPQSRKCRSSCFDYYKNAFSLTLMPL